MNKKGESESDLRQRAIDLLTSCGRHIDESTIEIVVNRLRARKTEGLRRKKGGIRLNFTEADVEREAERAWIERLLDEPDAAEVRRDAAYQESCDEEECRDLAAKFAHESAKKTGDAIGDVRDRYETIVIEFVRARSGGALIHDDVADPMTLEKLGQWLYAATKAPAGYEVWPELRRMPERTALLRVLAQEYARDRKTLMKFLRVVFERHCKIGEEHSTFRAKLCTQQLATEYEPKPIAIELERRGVVPEGKTAEQFGALRARVRQYLRRG